MKNQFFSLLMLLLSMGLSAQVGINTPTPHASAALDEANDTKGSLPPRTTTARRDVLECGTATVTFTYNGTTVTYGTVSGANNKCWLDRNLGAAQVATGSTDAASYGDLFQWGRGDDGHQVRNVLSGTTTILSGIDQPGHGDFILSSGSSRDWRSPQNQNLWQGVYGINNPCPEGYRVPTDAEWNTERVSWSSNNAAGAFASPLKLPLAGFRLLSSGSPRLEGTLGLYWSSTVNGGNSHLLYFLSSTANRGYYHRAAGGSVRCLREDNPMGLIDNLDCGSSTVTGTLTQGVPASGVSSVVPYTGGNGGPHNGQTVTSTGVTGLTATLAPGNFASGSGTLTYTITGTPDGSGTASFALNIGGQSCTLTRVVNPGQVASIDCAGATHNGTLVHGVPASGVNSVVSYTGGNGGPHNGQVVTSTGVTGLTATLAAGTFAVGDGTLTYTITGTPAGSGTASFALNIGGQSCTLTRTVNAAAPSYPPGTVHCGGTPTAIVDVTNPATGKTWMDRNLGASQVATSSTDAASYGDLYQWGRRADGHQCRNSGTTSTLSNSDQPTHGNFILANYSPVDWRSPQNDNLWQGVNGVNNPCPSGYRLPTETEWNAERLSWSSNNAAGAFASPLKLPLAGYRDYSNGLRRSVGAGGYYWSSTVSSAYARYLFFSSSSASMATLNRASGLSVRCLKD